MCLTHITVTALCIIDKIPLQLLSSIWVDIHAIKISDVRGRRNLKWNVICMVHNANIPSGE